MNLRTYDSFGKNVPLLLTETVLLERIVFIRNFDSKIYLNCYFSDSVKSSLLKIKSVKIVKMWPPRSESNLRLKILWTIIGQRSCVHAVETPIGDFWPIKIGSCVTWQSQTNEKAVLVLATRRPLPHSFGAWILTNILWGFLAAIPLCIVNIVNTFPW